nr:zinc finger, CCHC-type [Tanacetum cinerariifolium]
MVAAAMKYVASNSVKLDKFEGVDFRRWQKKMHFLLSNKSVVYMLTTHIPDDCDDATVKQLRKRAKWDNDDYVCRGLILKGNKKYFVTFIDDASVTPPDGAWTEYVSGGVTLLRISSTKHKERPLRTGPGQNTCPEA